MKVHCFIALLALGCRASEAKKAQADAGPALVDASSPNVARVNIDADPWLAPVAPPGFRTCHGDMDPPIDRQEASRRRSARTRAERPALTMRGIEAHRAASAKRAKNGLLIGVAGSAQVAPLADWARDVYVRKGKQLDKDLKGQLTSAREWKSFYADLLEELVPTDALWAFAGEDWRQGSMYTELSVRFYVLAKSPDAVVKALAESAAEPLSSMACAYEEHRFHRNYWRVKVEGSRLLLSANLGFGDYGGVANVDLRALAAGPSDCCTVLVACMYAGDFHQDNCGKVAKLELPK